MTSSRSRSAVAFWLLIGTLLLVPASSCLQAAPLELTTDFTSQGLGQGLHYWRDATGGLQWRDLLQKPVSQWEVSHQEVPAFGFDAAPYWLTLEINNPLPQKKSLVLEIGYPILNEVEAYLIRDGRLQTRYQLGDQYPFSSRPLQSRNFAIPMTLESGQTLRVLLRVRTDTSVQVPLSLWDRDLYFEKQQRYLIGQGLYFGITLVMALYNLFIFFTVRHSSYVYYSISVLGMTAFLASLHGLGFQYVWPTLPGVNRWITTVSLSLFVGGAAAFTNSLLQTRRNSIRFYYQLLSYAIAYGVLILLTPILPYTLEIKIGVVLGVLSSITAIGCGFYLLYKGVRSARYYVMAYSFLVFGGVLLSLNKFGVLPRTFLTEYAVQICSVIEILLLSFALADHINEERREKYKAKKLALKNEKLARTEHERYLQLQYNARLEELTAQQKIISAEAESRAKTEFLATMSHEIRTPMSGVLGMAELLQDSELQPFQRQYVDVIANSGKALLNIINDILDYSKIAAGKMALENIDFDLDLVCRECLAVFQVTAARKAVELRYDITPETPRHIRGDPSRLRQILLNLLGNAFKFTNTGHISLNLSLLAETDDGYRLRFAVSDTGVGISEDARATLFQAFSQADVSTSRQYGGTGLGLTISQRLVQLMQGEINVDSTPGKGSTFWFTMHCGRSSDAFVQAQQQTDSARLEMATASPWRHCRVLMAEDNEVNQMVINGMLKKLGIDCEIAGNGQLALARLTAAHDTFDLVLMDCEMPVLDGYATTLALREYERTHKLHHLPVLALTAHVMQEHQIRARECGMDDYLCKPVDITALKQKFADYLQPDSDPACSSSHMR